MTSAVFLQVRLDSHRLPGKALKIIEGKTVIEHAMTSLKNIPANRHILLTAEGDDKVLEPLAHSCGFAVFAGDRQDVLGRFIEAGRLYKPDIIIRATGDNPLVAWEPAVQLLQYLKDNHVTDYTAMTGLPVGCGVEVFRRKALEDSIMKTDEPYDHEHVTPYLYNHPAEYSLYYHEHLPFMENRVTLDTEEDYTRISSIFSDLYNGQTIPFTRLKEYLIKHD